MFLTERELKEAFWKFYNYSNRAKYYQFEAPFRPGGVDLFTVEKYQERFQFNAFEFKLQDVKKAILQAKANLPYVHKSWIVLPGEKKQLILEKYYYPIKRQKYIGVICVESGGRWEVILQPESQKEVLLHQELFHLIVNE